MKSRKKRQLRKVRWCWASVLGACAAVGTASAADTNAPVILTPQQFYEGGDKSYDNWVDLSLGAFMNSGNRSQFQQAHQNSLGTYGGLEDSHFQSTIAKDTTLSLDGRALPSSGDYKFKLGLERDKLGFLRFSYDKFRTWSSGNGGFYPPTDTFFPLANSALALDRGQLSVEGGLRLQNDYVPDITFKYTHSFRNGEKPSTSWGQVNPNPANNALPQGLNPSFYDINERRDTFQLEVDHHIKTTEFGAGLTYETSKVDDALNFDQYPGVVFLGQSEEQKVTSRQTTSSDLFSAHAYTESWIQKNLMFSTGFSYSDLDSKLSGSRIYGSSYDAGYLPSLFSGNGYYNLGGDTRLHEYVTDLNLLYKPTAHLTIVPSVRIERQDTDTSVNGTETQSFPTFPLPSFSAFSAPFNGYSDTGDLDFRERLDLTYNGITNWVFYGRGDLAEGSGNLSADGGLIPLGPYANTPTPITQQTDNNRLFQKYSAGLRWYPFRILTLDVGGYYKDNHYDYTHNTDSTPNANLANSEDVYPAFLVMQEFRTWDGNGRISLRPLPNVMLTSRYEYQLSTIQTAPDPTSGLLGLQSSSMTSHIIAQDISWSPWSRLYLSGGVNYVLSKTTTPASGVVQGILNAQNNYWMLNLNSGFVVDDKSDLNVSYFYYRANDYQNIATLGVPYGAGAEDQGITATLVRRLTKNLRLTLKYGCFHGEDAPTGGNANYLTQFVCTSLQYRF